MRSLATRLNRKVTAHDTQQLSAIVSGYNIQNLAWFEDYGLDDKSFDKRSLILHGKNKFEYRRFRAIELMNDHLDAVSAVSHEVANLLVQNGVDPELISVDYIGTKHYKGEIKTKKEKITISYISAF